MTLGRYIRWFFLSALVGLMAGLLAAVFLHVLQWTTMERGRHPLWGWALPFLGFIIGWIYHHHGRLAGRDMASGHNLILEEIHDPKKVIPFRMAPLVFLGTILTHLGGGSAGREGAAVQMSASLADQLSHFFRIENHERKILLVAGTGAGFAAAIGAPWAGALFGMEVIHTGRLKPFAVLECFTASFVGYAVAVFAKAPHTLYPHLEAVPFDLKTFFIVLLFGAMCGLFASLFVKATHFVEKQFKKISYPPLRPFLAGLLLVVLYRWDGSGLYRGLGLEVIAKALSQPVSGTLPFLKAFFTALTVGAGFKGGEFVPLVFMGVTLGSALSLFFRAASPLLATLGFSAVFAGAANTPIACTLLAMELFGPKIAPYALVACLMSYYCSGKHRIYTSQKILKTK